MWLKKSTDKKELIYILCLGWPSLLPTSKIYKKLLKSAKEKYFLHKSNKA